MSFCRSSTPLVKGCITIIGILEDWFCLGTLQLFFGVNKIYFWVAANTLQCIVGDLPMGGSVAVDVCANDR